MRWRPGQHGASRDDDAGLDTLQMSPCKSSDGSEQVRFVDKVGQLVSNDRNVS